MTNTFLPLLLIGLALQGCSGGDSSDGQNLDIVAEVTDEAVGEEDAGPEQEVVSQDTVPGNIDMNGVWAQVQVVATQADAPVIGLIKTRSVAVLKYDMEQTGSELLMHEEVCDLRLEPDTNLTETIVPDAFIQALPHVSKPAVLDLAVQPPTLYQPQFAELHGLEMDDPMNDPMPTSADDPRIKDLDGDGKPGLTIYVGGIIDGALYVVQRNKIALDGAFEGPDKVAGLMQYEQEQVVLGSDNQLLADNPPISSVDPDTEKTYFISVRMPDGTTCADILAAGDELFDLD